MFGHCVAAALIGFFACVPVFAQFRSDVAMRSCR
jgi:hypothetical protein